MPARRIAACLALTTQACTSTHQIRATDLPAEGIAWPNGEDGRPVDAARVEDEIIAFSRKAQALPTLTGEAVSVGGDFQGVLLAPGSTLTLHDPVALRPEGDVLVVRQAAGETRVPLAGTIIEVEETAGGRSALAGVGIFYGGLLVVGMLSLAVNGLQL